MPESRSPTISAGGDTPPNGLIGAQSAGGQLETGPVAHVAECKCPQPLNNRRSRNLIVCIDGTSNQFGDNNSNVVELYSRLTKSEDQLTYYNSGIGTYVKASKIRAAVDTRVVHHLADLLFAINFKEKVLKAYQWLSENYEDGDRIFLFGFSRGAYQVRVIAGVIEKVGLLHKGNNEQIAFAYGLYMKYKHLPGQRHEDVNQFKRTLSRPDVRVHFIGAWDTVSSIGFIKKRNLPETAHGMTHVCAFRHALALDELRVKFLPEYANGGGEPGPLPQVKEVWFAGSHSDVGGGHIANLTLNQFGPSLRWMSYEAIRHGLKLESQHGEWKSLSPTPSMNLFYKIMEYIPIHHLSYDGAGNTVFRWHRQKPRQMKAGQLIHASVFEEEGYTPKPCTHDGTAWSRDKLQPMTEKDPYTDASDILRKLDKAHPGTLTEEDIDVIDRLTSTEIGSRSITEYPNAANLLIASLNTKVELMKQTPGAEASNPMIQRIIPALLTALDAFKSTPDYMIKTAPRELWSVLEQNYPDRQPTFEKFKTIFGRPLFALIIGIDIYMDNIFRNLHGCVANADDIEAFLTRDLHISQDCIVILRNNEASHAVILKEIRKLAEDSRIEPGDPILIYFSGHAVEIPDTDSVGLIPYDTPNLAASSLSDATFNGLLKHLAYKKGNNITVILDTCYAGRFGGKGYAYASLESHVLLAGCSGSELSYSSNGHGVFTRSFTTVLRELGPRIGTVTYQDVVNRLSQRLPKQKPNCRGKYDNRILFQTRTPERRSKFHTVKKAHNHFHLEAGEIHGITHGAKFSIYSADDNHGEPIGSLDADNVAGFSTRLPFDDYTEQSIFPQAACGLQIRAGDDATVSFAIREAGLSNNVSKREEMDDEPRRTIIRIVKGAESSELVVSIDDHQVVLDITDKICRDHGLYRLPYTLLPSDDLYSTLRLAGDFFWDLRRPNSNTTSGIGISIEAHLLTKSDPRDPDPPIPVPVGANLNVGNTIRVFVEDDAGYENALGFTIRNTRPRSFYVWLFAFNMLDLAIDIVYKPCFSGNPLGGDPCLPKTGQLQVGYTVDQHNLPGGVDVGITYLKAFISTEYVDLSHLEKSSPFDRSSRVIPGETSPRVEKSTPLRLRGGGLEDFKPPLSWTTLLVPIIIKRMGASQSKSELGSTPNSYPSPLLTPTPRPPASFVMPTSELGSTPPMPSATRSSSSARPSSSSAGPPSSQAESSRKRPRTSENHNSERVFSTAGIVITDKSLLPGKGKARAVSDDA